MATEPDRLTIHFYVDSSHLAGTYFRFHNLAVGLCRLGHRVTVYAGDIDRTSQRRTELRDGVPYVIQPVHWLSRVCWQATDPVTALRRWAARTPPCDVAHLFQPFPGAVGPWLRVAARVRFYDWDDLWTEGLIHGPAVYWREYWPRLVIRFLENRLPRWAGHVTVVGAMLAGCALERAARQVTIIHNGFWPARQFPDRIAARGRLGLKSDAIYAGFMGRTAAEMPWCLDAVAAHLDRFASLRLAVCGAHESVMRDLPERMGERTDYLGQLSAEAIHDFAPALDLGLLPMEDNAFNRSRFPIKFCEHLATGVPLLCSTVGECGRLVSQFPWGLPAGTTRTEWVEAFGAAIERISRGDLPAFEPHLLEEQLSWEVLSRTLAQTYHEALSTLCPTRAADLPRREAAVENCESK
jgi:glycosyltransferase involved in cell wall biosynthesis